MPIAMKVPDSSMAMLLPVVVHAICMAVMHSSKSDPVDSIKLHCKLRCTLHYCKCTTTGARDTITTLNIDGAISSRIVSVQQSMRCMQPQDCQTSEEQLSARLTLMFTRNRKSRTTVRLLPSEPAVLA